MEFTERVALVVEDDPDIRLLLETVLTQAGFMVHSASTGSAGVRLAHQVSPLVVTLDVNLPDIDGFEVARRIRTASDAYLIMLTARGDEIDTLYGLDVGADDYMTKPFRPRELRARVEAMLRRPRAVPLHTSAPLASAPATSAPLTMPELLPGTVSLGAPAPATAAQQATSSASGPAPLDQGVAATRVGASPDDGDEGSNTAPDEIDGLRLSIEARTVEVDGVLVALTRSEFDILAELWASYNKVVTKHNLVRCLWGDNYDVGTLVTPSDHRSVEVHMANLRRKLGEDSTNPRWIDTVRGVGYRLNGPRR